MVNVYVVNNNIAYILQSNAATTRNVNISPTPIKGFIAIKNEFLGQFNEHVSGKHNPKGLRLYHSISESSWPWIDSIIIRGVSHYIIFTVLATHCVLPEPNSAIRQPLAIVGPVWVTLPAIIYGVTC